MASLLRRKTGGYVDDYDYEDEIEEEMEYRSFFSAVPVKPSIGRPSVLNRSVELDDILEEDADDREGDGDDENEGSPSPAAISSPSSHSPEGSFRLPRGASVRRSQESNESSSSSGGEAPITPPARKSARGAKSNNNSVSGAIITRPMSSSHKSHDSGFSDSGGSQNGEDGKKGKCAIKVRDVRSQVVHETRSGGGYDGKPVHVSKIYFYSVNNDDTTNDVSNDVISDDNHVSILDCETGRVRKGYAHRSSSPLLSPPLSPPPPPPISQTFGSLMTSHNTSTDTESSCDLPKLDPLACDIDYYDAFVVSRPHPAASVDLEQSFSSPR